MNFIQLPSPESYRSVFNPAIGFSALVQPKVNSFIETRVRALFNGLNLIFSHAEFIQIGDTITDKEFQNTSTELANSYFYELLFTKIFKDHDGSIADSVKYAITFDRDLTPLTVNNISYGTIKIANRPILFYVLFDLQELIRIAKS